MKLNYNHLQQAARDNRAAIGGKKAKRGGWNVFYFYEWKTGVKAQNRRNGREKSIIIYEIK
jgi:hypothetical protein